MPEIQDTKKVLEVFPDPYRKVKEESKKAGQPIKRFASLLLDYALDKLQSGELEVEGVKLKESSKSNKKGAAA